MYAAHLNIGLLEVAKVAIALSPQIARPMTHTQAGMHPQRPMQAMDTDNWDHSPSAHRWPSPLTMHVMGNDESIMRHNGSWLATWRSHDAHG